tara:strand:+ start:37 stop:2070 length:2034 start_codon:yes stop_codon:yes gene_type:complete
MNEEEELTDVEERRRYDERVQKDYEEIKYRNRELQRRQQQGKQLEIPGLEEKGEDKKTFLDEGSAFRTLTGLGVEVGGNLLLDAFSFVPGSQQVGSAGLNYIQQLIRGGPISKGEIIAAAAASQIPFLQSGKALTRGGRFIRSVGRGSTAGAIDSSVRPIIDEKRAPTVGEFATGVAAGGVFGGMFDLAPSAYKGNLKSDISEIADDGKKFLGELTDALTPGPVRIMKGDLIGAATFGGTSSSVFLTNRTRIRVPIDGRQLQIFDVRNYKQWPTIGDELLERSGDVVPDPTAPNYSQLQKINQQVFRNIYRRLGGGGSSGRAAFYSVVAENPDFSYVEHLVGKGRHMDWYWMLKNADRNGPDNVRLLLNDPYKQLKDIVENFGYGTSANNFNGPFLQNPNRQKRLVVDVEMPRQLLSKQGIPAIAQNQPGNIIIREAGTPSKPGRVIGKFGDYLDVLFRDEAGAIEGLLEQARQGKPALLKPDANGVVRAVTNTELRGPDGAKRRVQLSNNVVRQRYKQWRKELIEERIQEILDKKDSKLAISKKAAEQRINARILDDMEELRNEYPFLEGRARRVEQELIDADPDLSEEAIVENRPKSALAREADPRNIPNRGSMKGGAVRKVIKVKFKNGKGGEVIRRTDRNGNITYTRKKGGKEIFAGEFTEVTPSQYAQLPLV